MSAAATVPGDRWDVCGRCTHYRVEHLERRGAGRRCDHRDPDSDIVDSPCACDCPGFRPRTNASPRTSTPGRSR